MTKDQLKIHINNLRQAKMHIKQAIAILETDSCFNTESLESWADTIEQSKLEYIDEWEG